MAELVLFSVAFIGALLAFFSGFGMGTLLLPAMLLILPPPLAILSTALVHFANNIFKFLLVYKNIKWTLVLKFGLLSIAGAWLGAQLFMQINGTGVLFSYVLGTKLVQVKTVSFLLGLLIIAFAFVEKFNLKNRNMPSYFASIGGLISGFFGGLSGHQGALRSLFLRPIVQQKEHFIATGGAIALLVDITRMAVYSNQITNEVALQKTPIIIACTAALLGTIIGKKLSQKATLNQFDTLLFICLLAMGISLCVGLV